MPIKTYLTSEEIMAMINWPDNLRDRVILAFYADTGCRVSELLKLKVEDIDLEGEQALIPHLKRGIKKKCPGCGRAAGRNTQFCSKCGEDLSNIFPEGIEERSRMISLGSGLVELLKEYTEGMEPGDILIPLTRQSVYNLVRKAAAAVGLDEKVIRNTDTGKRHFVHPHAFRASLAVAWLGIAGTDSGKQKALQEHLGHKRFETTMTYNKLTPATVKRIGDEVRRVRFAAQAQPAEDESTSQEEKEG